MALRHYLGIAEPGPQNWSISFPAFPGVVTTGNSFSELLAHARDALASVIEAIQEDEQTIPDGFEASADSVPGFVSSGYRDPHVVLVPVEVGGRKLRINVTMDEGLVARLDSFADQTHSNRSALLALGARMLLAAELAGSDVG